MPTHFPSEEARQSLLSFRLATVAVLLALMVAAVLAQRFLQSNPGPHREALSIAVVHCDAARGCAIAPTTDPNR